MTIFYPKSPFISETVG